MHGPTTQSENTDVDVFRDAVRDGDLVVLNAALDALSAPSFSEDERAMAKTALLMLCLQSHPVQIDAAFERLLSAGAVVDVPADGPERPLAGMRPGMFCSGMTPLGQAIDNGDLRVVLRLLSAAGDIPDDGLPFVKVPHAGQIRVSDHGGAYAFNAVAFASACGQTEMVREMLSRLDVNNAAVRRDLGAAVDALLVTGMLRQGPDSILGDIVVLISRGANLSQFAVAELLGREICLDNGSRTGSGGPWKYAPFAALAIIAALPSIGAATSDVITTLDRLQEDCELDLGSVVLAHFPGSDLLDVADLVASRAISDRILYAGLRREIEGHRRAPINLDEITGEVCIPLANIQSGHAKQDIVSPHLEPSDLQIGASIPVLANDSASAADLFWGLRAGQLAIRRTSPAHSGLRP
jgi:hypothetical protein